MTSPVDPIRKRRTWLQVENPPNGEPQRVLIHPNGDVQGIQLRHAIYEWLPSMCEALNGPSPDAVRALVKAAREHYRALNLTLEMVQRNQFFPVEEVAAAEDRVTITHAEVHAALAALDDLRGSQR